MESTAEFSICSNKDCGAEFDPGEFDGIDLEFDEAKPLCPECAHQKEIAGETCEYHDDRPAQHWHGSLTLCDECYEEAMEHGID